MMLRRGEPWGWFGTLPSDAPVVGTDAELAALVHHWEDTSELVVGLAGGDLARTMGGRGDVADRLGQQTTLAKVDLGFVHLDDQPEQAFVAHLVARGLLWSGACMVAMNADRLGAWQPSPRAHPGDGLLDIVAGHLGVSDRLLAAKRARTGDHLPHPDITLKRRADDERAFNRPRRVYLDGTYIGRFRQVKVSIRAGAVTVAV